jgi:hypothetical protein
METRDDLFSDVIEEMFEELPIEVKMEMDEDDFEDLDDEDNDWEESDNYECGGYLWTEEDSWDALTDGMYGDMPSSPWEYDAMMDAMGF